MIARNINFGARIDIGTYEFLMKARRRKLNTDTMETLMKDIYPTRTISTSFVRDKADKTHNGLRSMIISSRQGDIPILNVRLKEEKKNFFIVNAYKITQNTVNKIVKRLQEIITKSEEIEPKYKNSAQKALFEKFGEPV